MDYVVYSDESHQDSAAKHQFMALGSLWVPNDSKARLSRGFRSIAGEVGLNSEIKWQKVSARYLHAYESLIDFYADEPELQMRVIVVDQSLVDLTGLHDGDFELAFYKFYYELLHKWMSSGHRYLVLLDEMSNQGDMRLLDLRRVLANKLGSNSIVRDVLPVRSRETPLMQLSDLLTGAVAAAWCGELAAESAKLDLIRHLETRLGRSLLVPDATPELSKFNVFKIRLR